MGEGQTTQWGQGGSERPFEHHEHHRTPHMGRPQHLKNHFREWKTVPTHHVERGGRVEAEHARMPRGTHERTCMISSGSLRMVMSTNSLQSSNRPDICTAASSSPEQYT